MAIEDKEQAAVQLLERLQGLFDDDGGIDSLMERLKMVEANYDELKGLDFKKAIEEIEKVRATQESLIQTIRSSKRGFYVPGIEDESFSLLKACLGIKTGRWTGAEKEKEILDAVRSKAAQSIGDDSLGGYFVPDQVIPEVIGAIYTRSVLINLNGEGETRVSVLEGLIGGNVSIPKFEGGLIAYWIGEEDEYAESLADVGDINMNPKKLGVLVKLTDAMRRFQGYGFEALLRNDMIRATAKKLDWTIMFGRGTDYMPRGIFKTPGIKIYRAETGEVLTTVEAAAVADWQGGELGFDGMMAMELGLEEDDIDLDESHAWISSPREFFRLKTSKVANYTGQTSEQPYLLGAPFISNERLADLIGPFDKSNQIPSNDLPGASIDGTTTSTDEKYTTVLGGNLSNVVLGRWAGLEIEDDEGKGKGFTSDHTFVKMRMYADVNIRQPRSIIVCPDSLVRA